MATDIYDKAILYCRRAIKARGEMAEAMIQAEEALLDTPESELRNSAIVTFEDGDEDGLDDTLRDLLKLKRGKQDG